MRDPLRSNAVPSFLVPAFSQPLRAQFSTTSPAQSRVGGAPISIPPDVSLTFIDLPQAQTRGRSAKDIPKTAVQVKGPLGTLLLLARQLSSN